MIRLRNSALLLLIGAANAGCVTDYKGKNPAMISNRSLYSENQPVVQRTDFVFDVSTDDRGVSASELGRLADWFETLQLRYGDRISIDEPNQSQAVRDDIGRLTGSYGLLLSEGAPLTVGTVQPGSARVVVGRATATVPGCPNWRQAKNSGAPNSTESNFGCATNSNLAAMIADPNDLVLGQEGVVAGDAAIASKAIKTYRDAQPTGAGGIKEVSTKGSN